MPYGRRSSEQYRQAPPRVVPIGQGERNRYEGPSRSRPDPKRPDLFGPSGQPASSGAPLTKPAAKIHGIRQEMQDFMANRGPRKPPAKPAGGYPHERAVLGGIPPRFKPDSTAADLTGEAMGRAAEVNRSHGATVANHPTGASNPLGSYADNFRNIPLPEPGPQPMSDEAMARRIDFLQGRIGSPDSADFIRGPARSTFPPYVEEMIEEAAKSVGTPRGKFGKYSPGSRLSEGSEYLDQGLVEVAGQLLPAERHWNLESFETPDGGIGVRRMEPLTDEQRTEARQGTAARSLAKRTGQPLSEEGESLVDSLNRLRASDLDLRSNQQALSRASRAGHNAQRYGGQHREDIYEAAMREYRRGMTPRSGGSEGVADLPLTAFDEETGAIAGFPQEQVGPLLDQRENQGLSDKELVDQLQKMGVTPAILEKHIEDDLKHEGLDWTFGGRPSRDKQWEWAKKMHDYLGTSESESEYQRRIKAAERRSRLLDLLEGRGR